MCYPQDCIWRETKVDRPYAILLCRHKTNLHLKVIVNYLRKLSAEPLLTIIRIVTGNTIQYKRLEYILCISILPSLVLSCTGWFCLALFSYLQNSARITFTSVLFSTFFEVFFTDFPILLVLNDYILLQARQDVKQTPVENFDKRTFTINQIVV